MSFIVRYIDGNIAFKTRSSDYSNALKRYLENSDRTQYDVIFTEDIYDISLENNRFHSCIFNHVYFNNVKFINTEFVKCIFNNCRFFNCEFDSLSKFIGCNFIGDCCFDNNRGLNEYEINPNMILKDHTRIIQALKMVNSEYRSPIYFSRVTYEVGKVIEVSKINKDPEETCGAGLHVATLPWIMRNWNQGNKLLLVEFSPKDIVIPYSSEGKYRVKKLRVVKELNPKKYGLE